MNQTTTYECPLCGSRFHDPRGVSLLGRRIRCGKCKQTFVLKQLADGTRQSDVAGSAKPSQPVAEPQAEGKVATAVMDLQDEPSIATAGIPTARRPYLKYGLAGVVLLALLAGGTYLVRMRPRPTSTVLGTVPSPVMSLFEAADQGDAGQVRANIQHGANVNGKDKAGQTALHRAACQGHKDVVVVLLEAGADVNARDAMERTPLWLAAGQNHVDVTELLVAKGTDVDARDNLVGQTALHRAASNGNTEIVDLLVKHGAGLAIKDKMGLTAADGALLSLHKDLAEALAETMFRQGSRPTLGGQAPNAPAGLASAGADQGVPPTQQPQALDGASSEVISDAMKELTAVGLGPPKVSSASTRELAIALQSTFGDQDGRELVRKLRRLFGSAAYRLSTDVMVTQLTSVRIFVQGRGVTMTYFLEVVDGVMPRLERIGAPQAAVGIAQQGIIAGQTQ